MTTFNTGNPIGSTDPRDLSDNSENFDNLSIGTAPAYNDRLGASRKSWAGIESEFAEFIAASGYEFVGDYAGGITITGYNQVVRDAGEFWRVSGSTALPYTTTGSGLPEGGAFVVVGDAVLRQELAASPATGQGAAQVNGAVIYVGSVAELAGLDVAVGTAVYLTQEGRAGEFVVKAGTAPSDPRQGVYITLTAGGYAERSVKDPVNVKWFGALGDGFSDDTSALQAFRDYLSDFGSKPPKGVLPGGIYKYSASPNWAINNLIIESQGNVFFRNTGTGDALIFDAGPTTETVYNINFGHVFVESGPSSGHGVFWRSCHHSNIRATVRGCGTLSNALEANFAVCTTFEVVVSVNQNFKIAGTPASGWYLDAKPLHGWNLTRRNAGEQVSASYFPVPIIEGVADTGIILDYAIMNRFIGGTSEANGNINLLLETNASDNTFDGIDLEVAGSTIGLIDKGDRNAFNEILNDGLTQIQSTAVSSRFTGGILNGISDSGTGTKLIDISYGSNGGGISELGTGQERMRCYNLTAAAFDPNKLQTIQIKSGTAIVKHLSATFGSGFAAPSVPGFTAAQNVNIPGAALGDTVVVSCSVAGSDLQFLDARVTAADTVSIKWGQLSGAVTTPGAGGETYRVDVWGH